MKVNNVLLSIIVLSISNYIYVSEIVQTLCYGIFFIQSLNMYFIAHQPGLVCRYSNSDSLTCVFYWLVVVCAFSSDSYFEVGSTCCLAVGPVLACLGALLRWGCVYTSCALRMGCCLKGHY